MHQQNKDFPVLRGDTQLDTARRPAARTVRSGWPLSMATPRPDRTDTADDIHGVCHDLRSHLATIGMIAAALRTDALPQGVAQRLDSLVTELDAATEMVRRVTTHGRHVTQLDLGDVVQSAVDRLDQLTLCSLRATCDRVLLQADELQLTRLVDNLLDNAARAAGPHGRVAVAVQEELRLPDDGDVVGRAAVLTVADSGPGFGAGTPGVASLGLHVVRAVLAELGGSLEIGRSELGGALVTVVVPLPV